MSKPETAFLDTFGRPFKGSDILPPNATRLERTFMDALGDIMDVRFPNRLLWSPEEVPSNFLTAFAWGLSPDLWDPDWFEARKRLFARRSIDLHTLKGTREGLRQFVAFADAKVVQVVTSPQGFFAARPPSKEQQDEYIRRLPEVRLYTDRQAGAPAGFFEGHDAAGHGFAVRDLGGRLLARKATIYRNGREYPLTLTVLDGNVERIVEPGDPGVATLAGHTFAGRSFIGGERNLAKVYTVDVRGVEDLKSQDIRLSAAIVGLTPQTPNIERASKRLEARYSVIAGYAGAGLCFARRDRSEEMTFDRLRLYDPEILAPLYGAGGYAGYSRVDMKRFHAEAMIIARQDASLRHSYARKAFAGNTYAVKSDTRQFERILEAVRVSSAGRDRVAVTLQTTRPHRLSDGIDLNAGFRFGQRLDRNL